MNRPKKKKIEVPELAAVRLLLRGSAAEPPPGPAPEHEEPPRPQAPLCPFRQLVVQLQLYVKLKRKRAVHAQNAYVKAKKQFACDERVREVAWGRLDRARPTTVLSVLDKREQKMHRLRFEHVQSAWVLETARAVNAEAQFEAEAYACAAKDAEINLLKRSLQCAKKS